MVHLAVMLTWSRLLMCVLVRVCFYCYCKTLTSQKLRQSRFISVYKSRFTVLHCGKSEKKLKAGTEERIITSLLLRIFFHNNQAHHPRCGKSHSQLALTYLLSINRMFHKLAQGTVDSGIFSSEFLPSKMTLGCVKWT